ncbi:hypothetical protein [Rickettsiales endosymbiont of Stachyamoeba lipophora]|uniref:hypothetical protein n=1 Tax=Rickettsiales endosymbiont of Stachyamoeba lipophora TaxID=2486578 RepID=UPI000F64779D|nr:hypothetical protein [Rickettsiales endosymbiont of Stachyamoeba lipophora]AZL15225.1 hypothetical protein EF513_01445 [Rickettsiales endosymbiont of Stachyamoeba lipophora]
MSQPISLALQTDSFVDKIKAINGKIQSQRNTLEPERASQEALETAARAEFLRLQLLRDEEIQNTFKGELESRQIGFRYEYINTEDADWLTRNLTEEEKKVFRELLKEYAEEVKKPFISEVLNDLLKKESFQTYDEKFFWNYDLLSELDFNQDKKVLKKEIIEKLAILNEQKILEELADEGKITRIDLLEDFDSDILSIESRQEALQKALDGATNNIKAANIRVLDNYCYIYKQPTPGFFSRWFGRVEQIPSLKDLTKAHTDKVNSKDLDNLAASMLNQINGKWPQWNSGNIVTSDANHTVIEFNQWIRFKCFERCNPEKYRLKSIKQLSTDGTGDQHDHLYINKLRIEAEEKFVEDIEKQEEAIKDAISRQNKIKKELSEYIFKEKSPLLNEFKRDKTSARSAHNGEQILKAFASQLSSSQEIKEVTESINYFLGQDKKNLTSLLSGISLIILEKYDEINLDKIINGVKKIKNDKDLTHLRRGDFKVGSIIRNLSALSHGDSNLLVRAYNTPFNVLAALKAFSANIDVTIPLLLSQPELWQVLQVIGSEIKTIITNDDNKRILTELIAVNFFYPENATDAQKQDVRKNINDNLLPLMAELLESGMVGSNNISLYLANFFESILVLNEPVEDVSKMVENGFLLLSTLNLSNKQELKTQFEKLLKTGINKFNTNTQAPLSIAEFNTQLFFGEKGIKCISEIAAEILTHKTMTEQQKQNFASNLKDLMVEILKNRPDNQPLIHAIEFWQKLGEVIKLARPYIASEEAKQLLSEIIAGNIQFINPAMVQMEQYQGEGRLYNFCLDNLTPMIVDAFSSFSPVSDEQQLYIQIADFFKGLQPPLVVEPKEIEMRAQNNMDFMGPLINLATSVQIRLEKLGESANKQEEFNKFRDAIKAVIPFGRDYYLAMLEEQVNVDLLNQKLDQLQKFRVVLQKQLTENQAGANAGKNINNFQWQIIEVGSQIAEYKYQLKQLESEESVDKQKIRAIHSQMKLVRDGYILNDQLIESISTILAKVLTNPNIVDSQRANFTQNLQHIMQYLLTPEPQLEQVSDQQNNKSVKLIKLIDNTLDLLNSIELDPTDKESLTKAAAVSIASYAKEFNIKIDNIAEDLIKMASNLPYLDQNYGENLKTIFGKNIPPIFHLLDQLHDLGLMGKGNTTPNPKRSLLSKAAGLPQVMVSSIHTARAMVALLHPFLYNYGNKDNPFYHFLLQAKQDPQKRAECIQLIASIVPKWMDSTLVFKALTNKALATTFSAWYNLLNALTHPKLSLLQPKNLAILANHVFTMAFGIITLIANLLEAGFNTFYNLVLGKEHKANASLIPIKTVVYQQLLKLDNNLNEIISRFNNLNEEGRAVVQYFIKDNRLDLQLYLKNAQDSLAQHIPAAQEAIRFLEVQQIERRNLRGLDLSQVIFKNVRLADIDISAIKINLDNCENVLISGKVKFHNVTFVGNRDNLKDKVIFDFSSPDFEKNVRSFIKAMDQSFKLTTEEKVALKSYIYEHSYTKKFQDAVKNSSKYSRNL